MKYFLLNSAYAATCGLILACPYAGLEAVFFLLLLLLRVMTIEHVRRQTRRAMIAGAIKIGVRATQELHAPAD